MLTILAAYRKIIPRNLFLLYAAFYYIQYFVASLYQEYNLDFTHTLLLNIACAVYLIIYSARFLDEFCISVFIFLQLIACINYLFIAIAYIYFSYDFYNIATSGYNTLNDILICLDVSVLFGVLFGTDRINDTSS